MDNITSVSGNIWVVSPGGKLTANTEKQLDTLFAGTGARKAGTVIIDFSDVNVVDVAALNVLVRLHAAAGKRKLRLCATGLNRQFHDVFILTGLNEGIRVFKDLPEALARAGYREELPEGIKESAGDAAAARPPAEDEAWAKPVARLEVKHVPPGAINLNVNCRGVAGPLQGFGRLWQKTYGAVLNDVNVKPAEIIRVIKDNLPQFQPPANRFYPSARGIAPGQIIIINADTPGGLIVTGVMVLYASESSFTFITPRGHPEAGWVSFAALDNDGKTAVQIQSLARAGDPVYETAFRFAGAKLQQGIWVHVMESLLKYLGSKEEVRVEAVCLDKSLRWKHFFNIFMNAQITTMLYAPVIFFSKLSGR